MLAELLIAQICAGLSRVDQTACTKALEAAGNQSHVSTDINLTERYVSNTATAMVTSRVDRKILVPVVVVAKVVRDRTVSCQILPPSGLRPAVTSTLKVDGGQIELDWKF